MIPIIALIGRTNVGKSSLFNILTKTRNALVANHQGLTKDRQYGYCELEDNKKIIIIDTAGLNIKSNEIEKKACKQTLIAIKEADLILFLVDAREGLISEDFDIADNIRKYQKNIILVVNKIDGIYEESKINEFYSLGFKEIKKISTSHSTGIKKLINEYLIPWMNTKFKKTINKKSNYSENIQNLEIKIAVIGKPNVGKSTLINNLLKEERMITSNMPGTTSDSISTSLQYQYQNYILIDTAGVSKNKKHLYNYQNISVIKTLKTIENSNVIILIIDASISICNQDLSLLNFIIHSGKGVVIVVNKSDLLNFSEKEKFYELIKHKLKFFPFVRIHFISALYKKGIFQLFKFIKESWKESKRKISTSKLTKIMHSAIKKHQPPIIKKNRIKLKYAHLGSSQPPKIIIHGNQVKYLSQSYIRYLINFFHINLKIIGTPIQIQFKENSNPYNKKK